MRRDKSLGWNYFRRMPTKSIKKIAHRSLARLQQRLVKTGGRLVKRARYCRLLLAERHLTRRFFRSRLRRFASLQLPTG